MKVFNCIVVACVLMAGAAARGQHADVRPYVSGGRIVTGAFDDGSGTFVPQSRVFGYDFGEVIGDPFFATDPGFNAAIGSGLPEGSQLRFNIADGAQFGLGGNLRYWNGLGDVSFGAMPSGETLRLNLGSQSRTAGAATGEIAGFSIDTVGANGTVHRHLNAFLQGSAGNEDPADGIYLVPLELVSSDPSVGDSLPFFLVYNNGLTEEVHDQAMEYVSSTLVPEPASLALVGIAALGLLRRRRT